MKDRMTMDSDRQLIHVEVAQWFSVRNRLEILLQRAVRSPGCVSYYHCIWHLGLLIGSLCCVVALGEDCIDSAVKNRVKSCFLPLRALSLEQTTQWRKEYKKLSALGFTWGWVAE